MPDNSRVVPTPAPSDLVTKTILVNGNAIASTYRVMSVKVMHAAHKIPEAEIYLLDGDVSTETFEVSSGADFMPGVEIEIKAGYHGHESTIFKGMIVKQGIKILQDQSSLVYVIAKHKIFKTALNRKTISFKDKKDSEVIESLITETKTVTATSVTHKHLLQPNCSDWDFINLRAEANSLFVLPKFDNIKVIKPDFDAAAALSLFYGTSMLEFEAEMDARNCFSDYEVQGWSADDQAVIKASVSNQFSSKGPGNFSITQAADALGNNTLNLAWHGDTLTENLDATANAAMLRHHLGFICGRAQCIGIAEIWPGDIVELHGVGDRFNGNAFVTGIQQTITEGRWDTNIQFGWKNKSYASQYDDIVANPAVGLMPGIEGLQIGIVKQLEGDPLSQFRVLIQLPTQGGADEAIWARMALLDAGKKRGSFFRPEIGDEVIAGFIDNNPLQAVILGCLHSSKNESPVEPADVNHIKGFYSRSEMKWELDDEKKIMTLTTPAKNKIVISDDEKGIMLEDENSNKIVMNGDGITITSSKDLIIKATGDISMKGKNIEMTADAQLKGSGSGGAEISSSAVTNVKGSMVNIN